MFERIGLVACGITFAGAACTFPRPPDAGGDASVDARTDVVTGSWVTVHHTPGRVEEVPVDLSTTRVQALIPDEAQLGGFRIIDGVGAVDGTFTIEGVPAGTAFYAKLGSRYWFTDVRAIQLRADVPVRAGAAVATAPTAVTFELDGLPPVVNGFRGVQDYVRVRSYAVGAEYIGVGPIETGATRASATGDWQRDVFPSYGGGAWLPDEAAGDDLYVLDERVTPVPAVPYHTIGELEAAHAGSASIRNGVPNVLAATLAPIEGTFAFAASANRSQLDAVYSPMTQFRAITFEAHVEATATGAWTFGQIPGLYYGASEFFATFEDWSRATQPIASIRRAFKDPFPASWQRIGIARYERVRHVIVPGTTASQAVAGFASRTVALAPGEELPPITLAPPAGVRIDGQDAAVGGAIRFDGSMPVTVSWLESAHATQFVVNVYRVFDQAGRTNVRVLATLVTDRTAVAMPPEIFAGGEFFAFAVTALVASNDVRAGMLHPSGLPGSASTTPTGMFRLSATCGDGVPDLGEACDAAGMSATCDVDCTVVACGDGLRNVAAGETCDAVVDTLGCDSDCTNNVCGDGHHNLDTEDCDDGDAVDDGDGCDAQCRFNSQCGDGRPATYGEACETTTDTAACDRDCTLPACGDSWHNAAAGEQCDDGNDHDEDGCSATCQLE